MLCRSDLPHGRTCRSIRFEACGPAAMLIAQRPPSVLDLPSGLRVAVATQRWIPEWWDGEIEPAGLPQIWARKPMVAVGGHPCCAEVAVVGELALAGWRACAYRHSGTLCAGSGSLLRHSGRFPPPARLRGLHRSSTLCGTRTAASSPASGRVAWNGYDVYNFTKFGVNGFTESLRREVTQRHVRVGAVEPGGVTRSWARTTSPRSATR